MSLFTRRFCFAILGAGILTACSSNPKAPDAVYYLVRHAEKTAEKPDPALTEAGAKRAQDLAARLSTVPLAAIYSSDYRRTRDTAAPIAAEKGLNVALYNPGLLPEFAEDLRAQKGHILVVGHSNTTPVLAGLLGGQEGEEIVEATEYDRLYVIRRSGEKIGSEIQRYGDPTQ